MPFASRTFDPASLRARARAVSCAFALLTGGLAPDGARVESLPERAPRERSVPRTAPNILFVLVDDLRWDGLGCYGNASIHTPHLDRLASQGTRLDRFYVAAPLCMASRAALLSGLTPHQTGVLNNLGRPSSRSSLRAGTPTVATYLGQAGYVTGFVGKAHLNPGPAEWDFQEAPVWLHEGESPHQDPILFVDGVRQQVEGLITPIFADAAIGFIERHRRDPWFLWLSTTAPHTPLLDDPAHPYTSDGIDAPPGWPPSQPLSDEDWPEYYSTIGHLDEQLGRVLATLDELDLTRDTFVFVMSDNGLMLESHGYTGKGLWFEESARAPALVRWPGRVKAGQVLAAPAVSTDFFATALELAGVPRPPELECRSLLPALTGRAPLRRSAYAECYRFDPPLGDGTPGFGHWQMLTLDSLKYVTFLDRQEEHLYDLAEDPFEQDDLVGSPSAAALLDKMRLARARWLAETP